MGLQPSNFQRHAMSALNYIQIAFSVYATSQFPGWYKDGYLDDNYFWFIPLWFPVGLATFGSLIGGIWWTIDRYKNTGKWW
jgi:hypothetical protein